MVSTAKRKFYSRHRNGILAFLLLLIPVGWWIALKAFPTLFGLGLGFVEWKGVYSAPKFNFLSNFKTFFTNSYYYSAIYKTLIIGGLSFISTTFLGLIFAVMLNKITRCKSLFRVIWYIPCVTSAVATSQIFNVLLEPYDGIINSVLVQLGREPVLWDLEFGWSVFWIVVYSTWKGIGASILMWLAALQSVDGSLVEAAQIDGATKPRTFFSIIIPQMAPITIFILINGFIGAMQIYEQVLFITNGGPYGKTAVLAYLVMRLAFWDNNFGMAGTASMIMLLITFAFTLIVFRKEKEGV